MINNNLVNFYDLLDLLNSFQINNYPVITIAWNIFLLSIPFYLGSKLNKLWQKTKFKTPKEKGMALGLFALWLLFAPNAAYVISDSRHISGFCPENYYQICPSNAWMIIVFFSYACIGWVTHVYLVNQMKNLVKNAYGKSAQIAYLWLISPIISLGLLLGLIDRWNSWDALIHPIMVVESAWQYLSDWTYFKNLLIYTIFLYLLYFVGDIIFTSKIKLKK